ncbi:hypothetical protein TWF281_003512 [Arthrobotrys megalospora]
MKPTLVHSLLYLAAGIQFADAYTYKCNADNCARGVTGTAVAVPITQRRADCSKFMGASGPDVETITKTVMNTVKVTKTVGTRTETITADSEAEETAPAGKKKADDEVGKEEKPADDDTAKDTTDDAKDVDDTPAPDEAKEDKLRRRAAYGDYGAPEEEKPAPATTPAPKPATTSAPSIPNYASYCSGTVKYSSACSCWGITKGVASPTTETSTVTKTTTQTVEVTAVVQKAAVVCSKTQEKCSGTCKNVFTDTKNCGACDVKCKDGASCVNGVCTDPDCDDVEEWKCDNKSKKGCNGASDDETFCMKGEKSSFCTSFANLPLCPKKKEDGCTSDEECGKGRICGHIACCGWNICVRPHHPDPIGGSANKASADRLFKSRKEKREDKLRLRNLAKVE